MSPLEYLAETIAILAWLVYLVAVIWTAVLLFASGWIVLEVAKTIETIFL